MPDLEPASRALHEAWWATECHAQPGDLVAAWDALWAVVPWAGWNNSKPVLEPSTRTWHCTASRVRPRHDAANIVPAAAPTELAVIIELARCLSEVAAGQVAH